MQTQQRAKTKPWVRLALVALLFGGLTVAYLATRPSGTASTKLPQNSPSIEPSLDVRPSPVPTASATDLALTTGPTPSTPTAPPTQGGRKDLLNENLAELFRQALEAKNPEDRALAFWLDSHCKGLAALKDVAPVSEEDLISLHGYRPDQAKIVRERWTSSRAQLQKFCSTGNAVAFSDALLKLKRPGMPLVGAIMGRIDLLDTTDPLRRQEHIQALAQVLASPGQYPAQFAQWLESLSFSNAAKSLGVDRRLVSFVADELMNRFGVEHMQNYRNLRLCVAYQRCFKASELPEGERAAVEASAGQMETLIRTQRWDIFFPQGG